MRLNGFIVFIIKQSDKRNHLESSSDETHQIKVGHACCVQGRAQGGGIQPPPPQQSMTSKDWTFSEYVLKWEFLTFSIMFIILFSQNEMLYYVLCLWGRGVTWCISDKVGNV